MNNNKQGGIQAGLNAHLSKPVQPDMLFETLENLIEIDSGLAILPLGLKTAWNTILSESEGSHALGFSQSTATYEILRLRSG